MSVARAVGAGLLGLPVLVGCADTTDTQRWASYREAEATGAEVEVRVYSAPLAGAAAMPPDSVRQLSDRGQAAYVGELGRKSKTADALRTALTKPISAEKPAPGESGHPVSDKSQRRLVVTLSRTGGVYKSGDRIMRSIVQIEPINFHFGGYTIVQTDRQAIDVATVQRQSSISGTLTIQPGRHSCRSDRRFCLRDSLTVPDNECDVA